MRTSFRWLLASALGMILGTAATVEAQPPTGNYNYDRAYRHFLNSRYSYRTLYSSLPGSGSVTVTPFAYESRFIEPGFIRQRITPFGYERFDAVPGHGGMTLLPFSVSSYYVPGYGTGYAVPFAR
jgi:hypothetical protein